MSAKANTSSSGNAARGASAHPLRAISFGDPGVNIERRADGTIYLRPKAAARRLSRAHHRPPASLGDDEPDRVFMAERDGGGGWREITYAELLTASRHIASALLARGLSAERPVVILSGNSIDHALLAFGALYAGIPFCPVSPAYSLVSKDYGKLRYPDEAADARPRLRRRRRQVCRRARRERARGNGDRGLLRHRACARR